MSLAAARLSILAAVVVCASACTPESRVTAPTPCTAAPAPPAPAPPARPFPPPSGPSRVYEFAAPLTRTVADYTRASRYVLYDNGAFELQYYVLGGSYRGGYEQAVDIVTFHWEGAGSGPAAWGASASLAGDTLTVRYNLNMQMSDFEDAVYQRRP